MTKLNFGCGKRFARGWVNIDFHAEHPDVQRVNLLRPWPFTDDYFDTVYSSHTLEHFSPGTAEHLLRECFRVMKKGAVIRIVVPDLEKTCREYIRLLDAVETSDLARRQYEWIILELLDQLTRTEPSGLMGTYCARLELSGDPEMINYVRSRTDSNPWVSAPDRSLNKKLRKVTFGRALNKLIYTYVAGVKRLLPSGLRDAILDNSRIGEKHRWMYDRYNMGLLMRRVGFAEIAFQAADRSRIQGFDQDHLDIEPDGSPYKPTSLYCEAVKPGG